MSAIPSVWRSAQRLHGFESGRVMIAHDSCSLERASDLAFHMKYGRSVDQIVEDHQAYVLEIEKQRGIAFQAILPSLVESQ